MDINNKLVINFIKKQQEEMEKEEFDELLSKILIDLRNEMIAGSSFKDMDDQWRRFCTEIDAEELDDAFMYFVELWRASWEGVDK